MRIPSVDERPETECPPLRVAVCNPQWRASAIASATSAGVLHSTIAAGLTFSKRTIGGLGTGSYCGELGRMSSPSIARSNARKSAAEGITAKRSILEAVARRTQFPLGRGAVYQAGS